MPCRKLNDRMRDKPIGGDDYRVNEAQILEVAKLLKAKEDALRAAVKWQKQYEDVSDRLDCMVQYLQFKSLVKDFTMFRRDNE